jgi:hypothetical protein
MSQTQPVTDPAYLEVPCTSCIASVDQLGWEEQLVPVAAGGYVLGIRANTAGVADLVRDLFPDRLVAGASPDRNYSLWLAPRADDGVRDLHRLYRTFVRTIRTRSARRAIDTLWHELDTRDVRASGAEPLFDVTVFVRDGEAHVLPGVLRRTVVDDLRRWEQEGFRLVERGWTSVDLATGEIVVPAPRFPISDAELTARLAALSFDDRDEGLTLAGRFPIATWTTGKGGQSAASRVGQAAMQILDREDHLGPALLGCLAMFLPRVGDLGPRWDGLDGLRSGLLRRVGA